MSDRGRRYRDGSSSPEPIIIERRPGGRGRSPSPPPRRRKSVSFGGSNPFNSPKRTVVIKESTIRRRRQRRRSRSISRSPSPPRGRQHIMDPRIGPEYVPLPKPLSLKDEEGSTSESERDKKKGRRKAKVVQLPHPDDKDAFPQLESPSSDRRDSGMFSMEGSPRARKYFDKHGRPTFPPSHGDPVQELTDQFNSILNKERFDKVEAEKAAVRAKAEAQDARAEVDRLKRQSWIDDREKRVADREQQLRDQKRISDGQNAYTPPREVIVVQPRPPVKYVRPLDPSDRADDPLKRAQNDYKKKSGGKKFDDRY